jgi:hypothetical protein
MPNPKRAKEPIAHAYPRTPDAPTLAHKDDTLIYANLWQSVTQPVGGISGITLTPDQRFTTCPPETPAKVVGDLKT